MIHIRYSTCGHLINTYYNPEYYDISVYYNYVEMMNRFECEMELDLQCIDLNPNEKMNAKLDYDIAKDWSGVRQTDSTWIGFMLWEYLHQICMGGMMKKDFITLSGRSVGCSRLFQTG